MFKGAVYAKSDGSQVVARDILGGSETFEICTIEEVDVQSERLILKKPKSKCLKKP